MKTFITVQINNLIIDDDKFSEFKEFRIRESLDSQISQFNSAQNENNITLSLESVYPDEYYFVISATVPQENLGEYPYWDTIAELGDLISVIFHGLFFDESWRELVSDIKIIRPWYADVIEEELGHFGCELLENFIYDLDIEAKELYPDDFKMSDDYQKQKILEYIHAQPWILFNPSYHPTWIEDDEDEFISALYGDGYKAPVYNNQVSKTNSVVMAWDFKCAIGYGKPGRIFQTTQADKFVAFIEYEKQTSSESRSKETYDSILANIDIIKQHLQGIYNEVKKATDSMII